ncbi:Plasmodium exported protein, unknown function [Plasmodium vivax]|uniref:Variable surface protein n=1 Tax=Plasmodium vivax TaxID=5855 RepID=A0A1G4H7S0_PLAVI|nr:Plasmodium exported protein, unknown function [Plasmodium vivax]
MKYIKMKNANFFIFIKIVTIVILTWMYNCNNDVLHFMKILEKERQQYGTINMRHFRLLAIKNGIPKELEYASCGNAFSYEKYKKLKMKKEVSSTYKRLKREGLNDFEIYKKAFECKYTKKKGLGKLDCYCEKKIFAKIGDICEFAKKTNNEKKCFKKISKKYGLRYGLSTLFVFIALLIIIISISAYLGFTAQMKTEFIWVLLCYTTFVVLPIIIFLVFFYIMIKVIKYERLMEGKVEGKKIAKQISCYYDDELNSP